MRQSKDHQDSPRFGLLWASRLKKDLTVLRSLQSKKKGLLSHDLHSMLDRDLSGKESFPKRFQYGALSGLPLLARQVVKMLDVVLSDCASLLVWKLSNLETRQRD